MRPLCTLLLVPCAAALAQQPGRVLTAADYARAEKFLTYNVTPLVYGADIRPNWIGGSDRFWYRATRENGVEFILVDPAKATRTPAFDHARLAAALSAAANEKYEAGKLPFQSITFSDDLAAVSFNAAGKSWKCTLSDYRCTAGAPSANGNGGGRGHGGRGALGRSNPAQSPDKTKTAFIRDYNLWIRDSAGKETQLTTDGVKDFGYATDNAGWQRSDRAIVLWSPDSRKIATFQQDERKVGDMYLVNTQVGHPKLEAWKYPLPGDADIATIQRVIIDVESKTVTRLKIGPDPHRSTLCDDIACSAGEWADVQWSPDSTKLAFISTSRDHKQERIREANAATGEVREINEETVATQYESGDGKDNFQVLYGSNEYLWWSERSGWGHLYLGDWPGGKIRNPITSGEWIMRQTVRVDEKKREIWFLGAGREKGDPYFSYLYKIGFDGKGLKLLTPENANHDIAMSPGGAYFTDSYSKPDVPPVTILREAETGKLAATLEKADVTELEAAGWKPPIPIVVRARDNKTDLYGLMFVPTSLDPAKKYPIVNHIYPGPQQGSVGSRSFSPARGDAQALAELGFVVVEIDGMGNPTRSKAFHDAYYGNMGDNTLPDQIDGMKQLAAKYPYIDLDRAGIYGHSGGGFATADAMFRYPDFFKVGISESGNHDNREYEDDWGERYQGLEIKEGSKTNYDDQANQNLAKNLKGHLLLAHGTMDNNVPPYNTLLVVDALIKANKDFDLLLLPNQLHGYGSESNYMTRRRWDYFVRYLLNAEPPKEYELKPPANAPAF
ncbi:MAG: DPP IV N-terminal domain-containing protein [Acidobacteriota bacterium]|nr:DPP IV N-terminal domain-containing protein [Acidobacteriota bacterium]